MRISEVRTKADRRKFILLPLKIYKNDPDWIRPLDKDIEEVFDPEKNKYFNNGEAVRFLLYDTGGVVIGRIAAFFNRKRLDKDLPAGGCGFFECVDDSAASKMLFDAAVDWLRNKGMHAMDGPINFGDRDRWWGLMVEGFSPPVYCMNYNPPYYQTLFESYGFRVYFNQYCFSMPVSSKVDEKFIERYHKLKADPDYHCERIKKNNLEKYAIDTSIIFNKAWVKHETSARGLQENVALKLLRKMKPIMDTDLLWYAYYKNEPIGFWLSLPEINQVVKHLNGKFTWWHKLKFMYLLKKGTCTKFYGILFGVVPEHQGKGVDGLMITEGANVIQSKGRYKDMELTWIGDFNPKMLRIAESLGAHRSRRLITYRKLFDETRPFERAKILV
jgi:hypothetical protein